MYKSWSREEEETLSNLRLDRNLFSIIYLGYLEESIRGITSDLGAFSQQKRCIPVVYKVRHGKLLDQMDDNSGTRSMAREIVCTIGGRKVNWWRKIIINSLG